MRTSFPLLLTLAPILLQLQASAAPVGGNQALISKRWDAGNAYTGVGGSAVGGNGTDSGLSVVGLNSGNGGVSLIF